MSRRIGHRLSEESKKKISEGMKRHHANKGKQENYSKVQPDDRLDILKLYEQATIPVATLARMYNISEKHLFSIINMLKEVDADE